MEPELEWELESELESELENPSRPGPAGRLFIPTSAMAGNFVLHARLLTHTLAQEFDFINPACQLLGKKGFLNFSSKFPDAQLALFIDCVDLVKRFPTHIWL